MIWSYLRNGATKHLYTDIKRVFFASSFFINQYIETVKENNISILFAFDFLNHK